MPNLIPVTINGKACEAVNGEYILEVARKNGVFIPTLCHHAALSGIGCCRICVVEVVENGRSKVVVSCVYPITRECEIHTESNNIKKIRRVILSMLRDRAPDAVFPDTILEACGFSETDRFTKPENEKCILCGLCVQACESVGAGAISGVGRGVKKKISTPYDEPSKDCAGCGSCASVCPTGAIEYTERDDVRAIWGRRFELVSCAACGEAFATADELALAGYEGDLCEACRRKQLGDVIAETFGVRK